MILKEFQRSGEMRRSSGHGPDNDGIRDKYMRRLSSYAGRALIVYASSWLTKRSGVSDLNMSVDGNDVHALMEVCHGVDERELDLILHSPGGSPEAAEQMVNYLRTQFDHIRAFVPLQAKSAATMIALGCDEIWMGLHSELGPIDPQILVPVPEGMRWAPAHAILRDFDRAKGEVSADVSLLAPWTPILRSYAGGLIEFCHQQIRLAQDVVIRWLEQYMLAQQPQDLRHGLAESIAAYFGSDVAYDRFRTHGRPIRVEELETLQGLQVRRLESDDDLQDAVLSVYHALDITLSATPSVKIVENHKGARHVRSQQEFILTAQQSPPPQPGAAPRRKGKR
jgi:hypothetical protein